MKRACFIWLYVFVVALTCAAAQRGDGATSAGDKYLGVWSGSWAGSGTGGFELTLEKNKDGTLGGRVSVTGDVTYKATLKSVAFDGSTMTAKYDFPLDEGLEIILGATFKDNGADGTWAARGKGNGGEEASGTWTVKKK